MGDVNTAYKVFEPYIPIGTVLTIEETDQRLCDRYIVNLTYTSKKSGRKITKSAKGDDLPKIVKRYKAKLLKKQKSS